MLFLNIFATRLQIKKCIFAVLKQIKNTAWKRRDKKTRLFHLIALLIVEL